MNAMIGVFLQFDSPALSVFSGTAEQCVEWAVSKSYRIPLNGQGSALRQIKRFGYYANQSLLFIELAHRQQPCANKLKSKQN
jgi:hypothetical protein